MTHRSVSTCMSGEYTIHNPTTGEIRVAKEGQAVSFGRMSWHYGYNFGDRELRVIEWLSFSPDSSLGRADDWHAPRAGAGNGPRPRRSVPRASRSRC